MIRLTREDLGAIKSYAESLIPVFGGVGSPPPQEEGFRFDDDVEWDALPMDEE